MKDQDPSSFGDQDMMRAQGAQDQVYGGDDGLPPELPPEMEGGAFESGDAAGQGGWESDLPPEDDFQDESLEAAHEALVEDNFESPAEDFQAAQKKRGKAVLMGALAVGAAIVGGLAFLQFSGPPAAEGVAVPVASVMKPSEIKGSAEALPVTKMQDLIAAPKTAQAAGGPEDVYAAMKSAGAAGAMGGSAALPSGEVKDLEGDKSALGVSTEIVSSSAPVAEIPPPPLPAPSAPAIAKVETIPVPKTGPQPFAPELVKKPLAQESPVPAPISPPASALHADAKALETLRTEMETLRAQLASAGREKAALLAEVEALRADAAAAKDAAVRAEDALAQARKASAAAPSAAKPSAAKKDSAALPEQAGLVSAPFDMLDDPMALSEPAKPVKKAEKKESKKKKEAKTAAPAARPAAPAAPSWVLRAATPDAAWVARGADAVELRRVAVGEFLSGIGRVKVIVQHGENWVVVGETGSIR